MRDGIALAKRGLPVAVLVTEAFERQANFVADAEGLPGLPRIVLPHPVAGMDDDYVARVADDSAQAILDGLSGR